MKRLRAGEQIAGVGAFGLFLTLFFGWFDVDVGPLVQQFRGSHTVTMYGVVDANTSGWSSLGWFLDALLVVAMVGALAMGLFSASAQRVGLAVAATVLTAFVGTVTFVVLLIRVVTKPGLGIGLPNELVSVESAAYVGLAFMLAIALGGWLALKDERTDAPESAYTPPEPRPAPPPV
jgi:hypothetical protein